MSMAHVSYRKHTLHMVRPIVSRLNEQNCMRRAFAKSVGRAAYKKQFYFSRYFAFLVYKFSPEKKSSLVNECDSIWTL